MSDAQKMTQDLTVKGESVERIYGNYRNVRYRVNRRYQRKLVWTLDEKCRFIDSVMNGYPVPIVLLAEKQIPDAASVFEIIDGMQRLNAIMGFIENEFSVNGLYFDLNTMADSKAQLDAGALKQREPIMPRDICVRIASYTVPLSIYEFSGDGEVDEVFRRINSGGRKLSRQELRIAGSTGHFAQAVRRVSAKVRGDDSSSDELSLNDMKKISIRNKELDYGIDVDELFWIKQGILTKEQVRESRDEEVVADLMAYMLMSPKPPSRSEVLDDFFGYSEGEAQQHRYSQIEIATQKVTADVVCGDFQRVLDQIKLVLLRSGKSFGELILGEQIARAPRYFQVVFLAIHKLMIEKNQEVKDLDFLVRLMGGSGAQINIPEGGRWGADDRVGLVNGAAGKYEEAFGPSNTYDPARVRWITQLENILTQSFTEQAAYDFKQGFFRLDGSNTFDENSFNKILKTLAGIANIGKGVRGYVLIGVADSEDDANRVAKLYTVSPIKFERFYITGVEHEASSVGKNLDSLFSDLVARIKASPLSEPLKDHVSREVKLVRYYDKSIVILESQAQNEPSNFDGAFYTRHGSSLYEIPATEYGALFKRFH